MYNYYRPTKTLQLPKYVGRSFQKMFTSTNRQTAQFGSQINLLHSGMNLNGRSLQVFAIHGIYMSDFLWYLYKTDRCWQVVAINSWLFTEVFICVTPNVYLYHLKSHNSWNKLALTWSDMRMNKKQISLKNFQWLLW